MPTATRARTTTRRRKFRRRIKPTAQVRGYHLNALRRQMWRLRPKPEKKYYNVAPGSAVITSTPTITELFDPNLGTGDTDLIGSKCVIRSLFIRLTIVPNASAGMNFLRFIVFQDRQANGVAPTSAFILDTTVNNKWLAPLRIDYSKRFKVIFDKLYTVDNDANGSQVDKIYRKLYIRYADAYGGNPATNGLYLLMVSDQATNGPSVDYVSRVRYTDM